MATDCWLEIGRTGGDEVAIDGGSVEIEDLRGRGEGGGWVVNLWGYDMIYL